MKGELLELGVAALVGGAVGAVFIYLGLAWFLGAFRRP
jgi:ABC-type enterobactin transport system permease subunit